MSPVTTAKLLKFLTENPVLEVTRHPDPRKKGKRRFLHYSSPENWFVFMRTMPDGSEEETQIPVTDDLVLTADGFTIMSGQVIFRPVPEGAPCPAQST